MNSHRPTTLRLTESRSLVLARIHLADEVERVNQDRIQAMPLLRRLGKAYVDGCHTGNGYRREIRILEEKLNSLVAPLVEATEEAGKLPKNLPSLWEEADLLSPP